LRQEFQKLATAHGVSTPKVFVSEMNQLALGDWALGLQQTMRVWLDGGSFDRDVGFAVDRSPHAFVFQPFSQANLWSGSGQTHTGCAPDGVGIGCSL
jgi:hypothetical protein